MSRAFKEDERSRLEIAIKQKSRELFMLYGLKKTSIDQIVQAVGIAKGSFYSFYPSKEVLFFEIILEEQAKERAVIFEEFKNSCSIESFSRLVKGNIEVFTGNRLIRILFNPDEFAFLAKKLPAEYFDKHTAEEKIFFRKAMEELERSGIYLKEPPDTITEIFQGLLAISHFPTDLGYFSKDYQEKMVEYIIQGLLKRSRDHVQGV